jgi:transcriptional regulator with XRE-family HTH domain
MNGENNDTSLLDPVGFGKRFKERREFVGLKQEQLKDIVGFSIGAVQGCEAGKNMPNSKYLWAIANALKCRIGWLLTGEGPIEPGAPPQPRARGSTGDDEVADIELPVAMQLLSKIYHGTDPNMIFGIGRILKTFGDAIMYRDEAAMLRSTLDQVSAWAMDVDENSKPMRGGAKPE